MSTPTVRRYPRTTAEAFGGTEYACAVERPEPTPSIAVVGWICAVGLVGLVLSLLRGWI